MKDAMPVLAAGGTFAGCALLGLGAGVAVSARTGHQLWVLGGLLLGLALGAYSAIRLLVQSR